jgi:outer membrane assembly lipoprotein YfgL
MMTTHGVLQISKACLLTALIGGLAACSSGSNAPKAADLCVDPALLGVTTVWTAKVGPIEFPLSIPVKGNAITVASSTGNVVSMDASTGTTLWQLNLGGGVSAGVGSDGRYTSIVNRENELVTIEAGRELWRSRLTAQVFTAPLVAGERVFVLGADRSVSAFDALSGKKLWSDQRPGEALVLRQAGVLTAVGNTLIVGLAGRLAGLNPLNGALMWDVPIATPRGTNDVERLVDLVAGVGRNGQVVCARAFQAAVGCVNTARGTLIWKQTAAGSVGLQGDDKLIYGVEEDGVLMAWRTGDGGSAWSSDRLRYRHLSAPLVLGRSLVVGDESGLVHFVSRSDGSLLTRRPTDGSAVLVTPVAAGQTLVVVTRNGMVLGFQPE